MRLYIPVQSRQPSNAYNVFRTTVPRQCTPALMLLTCHSRMARNKLEENEKQSRARTGSLAARTTLCGDELYHGPQVSRTIDCVHGCCCHRAVTNQSVRHEPVYDAQAIGIAQNIAFLDAMSESTS